MLEILSEDFVINAIIAGIGIAIIAGVIGCFVVWRKMAYFGDSLAHSSLLGIAFGSAIGINFNISVIFVCIFFAIILTIMQQKKILATDTILGILAHSALSIGMVVISLIDVKINLHSYLFGDILTVSKTEIYWIYITGFIILSIIFYHWPGLILATISEDMAKAENIKIITINLLITFIMAAIISISIKIVGILLITSMLIIPAATARNFAKSPESMAIISVIIATISVILGIIASIKLDTPTAPTIVSTQTIIFTILFPLAKNR